MLNGARLVCVRGHGGEHTPVASADRGGGRRWEGGRGGGRRTRRQARSGADSIPWMHEMRGSQVLRRGKCMPHGSRLGTGPRLPKSPVVAPGPERETPTFPLVLSNPGEEEDDNVLRRGPFLPRFHALYAMPLSHMCWARIWHSPSAARAHVHIVSSLSARSKASTDEISQQPTCGGRRSC